MIDPAAIPTIAGDMDVLAGHAATVSGVGTAFADTGARVHATWQELGAVYHAPEAAQLLAATGPVATVSASVSEDITAVVPRWPRMRPRSPRSRPALTRCAPGPPRSSTASR